MRKQLAEEKEREDAKRAEAEELREDVERLKAINVEFYAQAASFQQVFDQSEKLQEMLKMRQNNRDHILDGMSKMDGELLSKKHG